MATVIATRSELLARRRRMRFAEEGRDLLKDKRATLVLEFQQHRADLLSGLQHLAALAAGARQQLDDTLAEVGPEAVASAALTAATGVPVELRSRTVAGVPVIDLEHGELRRTPFQRGWARVLVHPRVDATAQAYEELLQELLDLGVMELTIRRLAGEIAKTTRQINALDNVLLPRLEEECHQIILTLDEREREEHTRLRHARGRQASRDAEARTG